jgi:hypothetical protein
MFRYLMQLFISWHHLLLWLGYYIMGNSSYNWASYWWISCSGTKMFYHFLYPLFIHIYHPIHYTLPSTLISQPAKNYPKLFDANSLFGRYVCYKHIIHSHHNFSLTNCGNVFVRFPYLLPCLCVSIFCFIILISCIWLPVCKLSKLLLLYWTLY